MSDTPHTPGPWIFWDDDGGRAKCIAGHPQSGKEICELVVHSDEMAANLNLIAAAPDLLAALKDVKLHCELNKREGSKIYPIVCRAISKAEKGLGE